MDTNYSSAPAKPFILCIALSVLCACGQKIELVEASGLVRQGEKLLIVSDDSAGAVFSYHLPGLSYTKDTGLMATFTIATPQHQLFAGNKAADLESIDILPNGKIVVLSEQANALFGREGLLAQYPDSLQEVAGRGLEGMSIHPNGQIVVLWEGGYYSPIGLLPKGLLTKDFKVPQLPRICMHRLPQGSETVVCHGENSIVDLKVPATPDANQSFRAPDLVWAENGNSLIVMLASLNAANDSFRFLWLQKFTISGEPFGSPLNLCAKGFLPEHLRDGPESNIEGLAWFEHGKSLILINDTGSTATAALISVDPCLLQTIPLLATRSSDTLLKCSAFAHQVMPTPDVFSNH